MKFTSTFFTASESILEVFLNDTNKRAKHKTCINISLESPSTYKKSAPTPRADAYDVCFESISSI